MPAVGPARRFTRREESDASYSWKVKKNEQDAL